MRRNRNGRKLSLRFDSASGVPIAVTRQQSNIGDAVRIVRRSFVQETRFLDIITLDKTSDADEFIFERHAAALEAEAACDGAQA
jgi:hypothetical protein